MKWKWSKSWNHMATTIPDICTWSSYCVLGAPLTLNDERVQNLVKDYMKIFIIASSWSPSFLTSGLWVTSALLVTWDARAHSSLEGTDGYIIIHAEAILVKFSCNLKAQSLFGATWVLVILRELLEQLSAFCFSPSQLLAFAFEAKAIFGWIKIFCPCLD